MSKATPHSAPGTWTAAFPPRRFIACILIFVFCIGGCVAHGEKQLPSFARATPEPAVSDGLPAFSRPTPAAAPTPKPTPKPTLKPAPRPTSVPTPNSAVLFSEQGIQFEIADVYLTTSHNAVELKFVGTLTNNGKTAVCVEIECENDPDGLNISFLSDKTVDGQYRYDYPSGVYQDVSFEIGAKTEQSAKRLLAMTRIDLNIKVMDSSYNKLFTNNVMISDVRALSRTPEKWIGLLVHGGDLGTIIDDKGVRVNLSNVNIAEYDTSTCLKLTFSGTSENATYGVTFGYFRINDIEAKDYANMLIPEDGTERNVTAMLWGSGKDRATFRYPLRIHFFCMVTDQATGHLLFCAPASMTPTILRAIGNNQTYSTLKKGDKGTMVEALQRRLIALNYLFGKADGEYGGNTAAAVKAFCSNNKIPATEVADSAVLQKLYSIFAIASSEPDFALTFNDHVQMHHYKEKGDKLKFRIEGVQNLSEKQNIKSFELRVYAENAYGFPIYGSDRYYNKTTEKTIAPGKSVNSDYLVIPNRSDICSLYVGISQFTYSNGRVVEADPVRYWRWDFSEGF